MNARLRIWFLWSVLASALIAREPVPVTLYDANPSHPWNRLRSELLSTGFAADALDLGLRWGNESLRLLKGDKWVNDSLRTLVSDSNTLAAQGPVQRALMQRDLLSVFHWLMNRVSNEPNAEERELLLLLARACKAVALSAKEIARLPDNYAVAANQPDVPSGYDDAKPLPFLPKDLLADQGPWLLLKSNQSNGIVATRHFSTFTGGSAFEVRMRHPDGREAGIEYLKRPVGPWPPLKPTSTVATFPASQQFPVGTVWALVRRAVLMDQDGKPVVSPLVESVQARVYRAIDDQSINSQFFFVWEMQPSHVLAGTGFHLVTSDEYVQSHFLNAFRVAGPGSNINLNFCMACHSGAGIKSVQSWLRFFEVRYNGPPQFEPTTRKGMDELTLNQLQRMPTWVMLDWITHSSQ